MKKSLAKYLLLKYLRFDRDQPFINLSMILAFLGVCVGICVLLVAMAIMNGFDKEFEKRFFTMSYPITVLPRLGRIDEGLVSGLREAFPELGFSPYLATQVVVRGRSSFEGAMLLGVNFEDEKKINEILATALGEANLTGFELVAGAALIRQLDLRRGDKLPLIFASLNPSGLALLPQSKRFTVAARFSSGLAFYDKSYLYAPADALRRVLGRPAGEYDGLHIFSPDAFADAGRVRDFLGEGYSVLGWWEQNSNFFAALRLEKTALFIVLMLIILVASLNIVSSLLMIVMSRRAEIALLLALGASRAELRRSFFGLGLLIGGGGMVLGIILAMIALWVLGNFELISLPEDVYGTSQLPLDLSAFDFGATVLGAALIIALSSFYPARKATQVDVLHTLRNE